MAEYIEREALRSKAVYMHGFGNNKYVPLRAIEDAPAANVAPVVHGDWTMDGKNHCHCSICAFGRSIETQIGWHYCPNCGARMDGESE